MGRELRVRRLETGCSPSPGVVLHGRFVTDHRDHDLARSAVGCLRTNTKIAVEDARSIMLSPCTRSPNRSRCDPTK